MLILVPEVNEQDQVHTFKCINEYFYIRPLVKMYHHEHTFHDICQDFLFQIFLHVCNTHVLYLQYLSYWSNHVFS